MHNVLSTHVRGPTAQLWVTANGPQLRLSVATPQCLTLRKRIANLTSSNTSLRKDNESRLCIISIDSFQREFISRSRPYLVSGLQASNYKLPILPLIPKSGGSSKKALISGQTQNALNHDTWPPKNPWYPCVSFPALPAPFFFSKRLPRHACLVFDDDVPPHLDLVVARALHARLGG